MIIVLDGRPTEVAGGASVAAALSDLGHAAWRTSRPSGAGRGVFCGMGSCYDCTLTVDGRAGVRACLVPVEPGMRVDTDRGGS